MLGLFILFNRSHQIINMLMAYQLIDPLKIEDHHDIVFMAVERFGNDSNLLIVFYVQIMPDDFVMQLHRF